MSDQKDLNLDDYEAVPVQQEFPPPEIMVRAAGLSVQKFQTPSGEAAILRFITPSLIFSFQLDHDGAKALVEAVNPSKIVPATMSDLPREP